MDWKYYIPHSWASGSRHPWGDVWLMPQDPRVAGRSVSVTINALGDSTDPTHGDERREFQEEALRKLGDQNVWINGADMIVRVRDFGLEEFLKWVKVWIKRIDPDSGELNPGTFEEFSGTNTDARLIERLLREYPDAAAGL